MDGRGGVHLLSLSPRATFLCPLMVLLTVYLPIVNDIAKSRSIEHYYSEKSWAAL